MSGPILTLDNLFTGSNQEETLDVVEILPVAVRNTNSGTITLTEGVWSDFDSIEAALGVSTNELSYCTSTASREFIAENPGTWNLNLSFIDTAGTRWRLAIVATGTTTATWSGSSSAAVTTWPLYLTGYKKRYSTTSLEQLLVMAQKPNLFVNSDHTKKPFNQRNFNGNWGALADGQYGLDRWMKYSATHKGFAVDDGEYLPNTAYTFDAEGITRKTIVSPASGIWGVAVPFDADKMNGRCGRVLGDWQPEVQESKENSCLRHAEKVEGAIIVAPVVGGPDNFITLPLVHKRAVPAIPAGVVRLGDGVLGSITAGTTIYSATNTILYVTKATTQPNPNAVGGVWLVDTSITKAEVGRWDVLE